MSTTFPNRHHAARPSPGVVLEFFKPVTWFPPMWAFACGIISSGASFAGNGWMIFAGVLLAGPMVCATSQAVNDWYDRDVDAINQPERPIPSGRLPGQWGWYLALLWTALSLLLATVLGPVGFAAAAVGLLLAWAYSAPPLRFKQNGWIGNTAVGLSYEGLPWITGAAVMLGGNAPAVPVLMLAFLYSIGAHGIMTLNDFKSIKGDRRMGIDSLPASLGVARAARCACLFMAVPQVVVVMQLNAWGQSNHAIAVLALLVIQVAMMIRFLAKPAERALWYSAFGVILFVSGMMVSAFAVRGLAVGI